MPITSTAETPFQAIQSKIQQLAPTQQAVVTHYISNLGSEFAESYKVEAEKEIRNLLDLEASSEIPASVLVGLREFVEEVPFQTPTEAKFSFIDLLHYNNPTCMATFQKTGIDNQFL